MDEDLDFCVDLDDLICPAFRETYESIINCEYREVVLKGGRGSTKSQTSAYAVIQGVMDSGESACCIVRNQNKVKDKLVDVFSDAMERMGVSQYWKLRKSPYEYVLLDENGRESNVSIKFTGAEVPKDLRSFKPRKGHFRYTFIDEASLFNGIEDMKELRQTFLRGDSTMILAYNPPKDRANWCNAEYEYPSTDVTKVNDHSFETTFEFKFNNPITNTVEIKELKRLVHSSSYLDVVAAGHVDWLGFGFIGEAEEEKAKNPDYYNWKYLGMPTGTEANVFKNIRDWDGNVDDLDIDVIYRGLDFGNGASDPHRYTEWYYDSKNRSLYCLNEYSIPSSDPDAFEKLAFNIKKLNKHNFTIRSDGAVPTFSRMLRNQYGLNVTPAKKRGEKIVRIEWLANQRNIHISKFRTPLTHKEFNSYSHKLDKLENVLPELKDGNDHSVDSCTYALCDAVIYPEIYI